MQICDNLSVSAAPSQLPWKGSQGGAHRRRFSELRDNLSVSLRLTAPLKGEPLVRAKILGLPFQGRWHGEAVTERLYRAAPALFRSL